MCNWVYHGGRQTNKEQRWTDRQTVKRVRISPIIFSAPLIKKPEQEVCWGLVLCFAAVSTEWPWACDCASQPWSCGGKIEFTTADIINTQLNGQEIRSVKNKTAETGGSEREDVDSVRSECWVAVNECAAVLRRRVLTSSISFLNPTLPNRYFHSGKIIWGKTRSPSGLN